MENQELFKQAILDAKAVRETAMAAARTTLAEHFEPFIKETMAKTLSEEVEETVEEGDSNMEEKKSHMDEKKRHMDEKKHHMEETDHMEEDMKEEGASMMDEAALDEILAELDALSEEMEEGETRPDLSTETVEEGHVPEDGYTETAGKKKGNTNASYSEKAKVTHGDHKLHEADEAEKDDDNDDEKESGEAPEGTDEQEVVDITVGELKDIIRDVFMQLQGGLGSMDQETFDAETDLASDLAVDGDSEEKEISLDEILAELEEDEKKKMEEAASQEEIPGGKTNPQASDVHDVEEMKRELKEAVKTIKALRTELNEVNLFSAKMLYVNKIFKAKSLNESQKTKVINAFDRATSVKEVENTYKTLLESFSGQVKKSSLRESVGFASKPIGSAPARPIVEADVFVSRWQKLAGIK
jgi:hypothetical protein